MQRPPPGKPSRNAKSDVDDLWERLTKHESAVLRFVMNLQAAFRNNGAESDLRIRKVKQKVSDCLRETQYAEA